MVQEVLFFDGKAADLEYQVLYQLGIRDGAIVKKLSRGDLEIVTDLIKRRHGGKCLTGTDGLDITFTAADILAQFVFRYILCKS